jgi:hypothetical protein
MDEPARTVSYCVTRWKQWSNEVTICSTSTFCGGVHACVSECVPPATGPPLSRPTYVQGHVLKVVAVLDLGTHEVGPKHNAQRCRLHLVHAAVGGHPARPPPTKDEQRDEGGHHTHRQREREKAFACVCLFVCLFECVCVYVCVCMYVRKRHTRRQGGPTHLVRCMNRYLRTP